MPSLRVPGSRVPESRVPVLRVPGLRVLGSGSQVLIFDYAHFNAISEQNSSALKLSEIKIRSKAVVQNFL